jgi:hypothetical protein
MRIAIMQPYLFPYIGYFQLINAVDKFIIYDDVSYIKQGWINRNRILLNGNTLMFTVPLNGASSNKLIHDIPVGNLSYWNKSFYKTIECNYKKAPFFKQTLKILEIILTPESQDISKLCLKSFKCLLDYFAVKTQIVESSRIYKNQNLKAQNRVLDICLKEQAKTYINPIGGTMLYSKDKFLEYGIQLKFIKTKPIEYKQFDNAYIPWLSIIDVMMFNSPLEIKNMLNQYELV